MSIRRSGLAVACEQCALLATHEGSFDITVPVRTPAARGVATLRCREQPAHTIELVELKCEGSAQEDEGLRREVTAFLQTIATKRLCGNERLCPAEVIQLAQGLRRTRD